MKIVLVRRGINQSLRNEALAWANSLYTLNAKSRIGYLFNADQNGKEIACGEFCFKLAEIDPDRYDYFIPKEDMVFFKQSILKNVIYQIYRR